MDKYKYEKYNYNFLQETINYFNLENFPKDFIIKESRMEDNILYITFYNGLDNITIDFNINNLNTIEHEI